MKRLIILLVAAGFILRKLKFAATIVRNINVAAIILRNLKVAATISIFLCFHISCLYAQASFTVEAGSTFTL